ncbi:unnamed protein product [Adineta steineri]|uniref:EGF-like domain-containing protein n=1 Tax=Adineta steineri TaxID=433720 RepID=A0A813PK04_9BILA|nr:unnamed protein product [Adineta steineri]CAF3809881.1 unnamed protein product [Adineta steineri]
MYFIIILSIISGITALSYNLPKFCPNATWYENSTIFPSGSTNDYNAFGLFINTNNTIYINSQSDGKVIMWLRGAVTPTNTIFSYLVNAFSIFITETGIIYADQGNDDQVMKAIINSSNETVVMNTTAPCTGLFIDTNNVLYCSMYSSNRVIANSLNNISSTVNTVAGNGSQGSNSMTLSGPHGIFVDGNFRLYVADCNNNRIQRFDSGSLNATTIVKNGSSTTVSLDQPTGIVLDADGNLFIADRGGNRIVRFEYNGTLLCIIGCTVNTILKYPETMSFDSNGNIYVTGRENKGIQKFALATNSCNTPSITTILQSSTVPTNIQTTITNQSYHSTEIMQSSLFVTTIQVTAPTLLFIAPTCSNQTYIGIHCNISATPCDLSNLCQNNATCQNINTTYRCNCLLGFNGTECQFDQRPCQPNRCWNNGTCNKLTNETFNCTCASNWAGIYCERMINYCENVSCENEGVCRPLLGDYRCECLDENYSGRHCEISSESILVHKIVSKLFAVIAILAIAIVIACVIIMDILKYCFNIDPVRNYKLKSVQKKKRQRPEIIRHIYKNARSIV